MVPGERDGEADEAGRYALDFQWDQTKPNVNEDFDNYRAKVLEGMTGDNQLEIIGLYHDGEASPQGFDNLGFARAEAVKALFSDVLPAERMVAKARNMDEQDNTRTGYFEGVQFDWKVIDQPAEEATVETLADREIVRFPYKSTDRISDQGIDEYLAKLAARVKETGEIISLIGHTDNVGGPDYNLQLGRQRAQAVQRILLDKGVPSAQIRVDSKGQSQPVASNDTESGRSENRRVEVRLLSSN
jgi:OOP family OmpA-OmpF porin